MHKMPKTRARVAAAAVKVIEPVMPAEPEEQVELDGSEEMDEEVEYEEDEEEEGFEVESDNDAVNGAPAKASVMLANKDLVKEDVENYLKDESKKHAELLSHPPHGSEVYVGNIPPDLTEEDLRSFCEPAGEVYEVRMMKGEDSSENKGYAFVTFRTKELAATAIEKLNNIEFKGRRIKCSTSHAKHRLFIGNIPRNWTEEDLKKAVLEIGTGVTSVDLMNDPQNSSRNRGFAFIEFYNYACAEYARKQMAAPKFKLDSNAAIVSWADPISGDSSSQIKSVYVKNLPKDVNQDQLKTLFEHHGEISKVVLPTAKSWQEKRFGFVHFVERSSAMKALKNTEIYEINGAVLECSLAKPQADKVESGSGTNNDAFLPNYSAGRLGYGIMGGPYGPLAPSFPPAMIYGNRGTAMASIMLPDGRIAHVVQQPGCLQLNLHMEEAYLQAIVKETTTAGALALQWLL